MMDNREKIMIGIIAILLLSTIGLTVAIISKNNQIKQDNKTIAALRLQLSQQKSTVTSSKDQQTLNTINTVASTVKDIAPLLLLL